MKGKGRQRWSRFISLIRMMDNFTSFFLKKTRVPERGKKWMQGCKGCRLRWSSCTSRLSFPVVSYLLGCDRIDLSPFTFPQEHSHVFIGSKSTSMRAIDLQTGQDVSSFSPPTGKTPTETTPAGRPSPEACEWNAEWGFEERERPEGECESDIDERPEDKLFIGQTCT